MSARTPFSTPPASASDALDQAFNYGLTLLCRDPRTMSAIELRAHLIDLEEYRQILQVLERRLIARRYKERSKTGSAA